MYVCKQTLHFQVIPEFFSNSGDKIIAKFTLDEIEVRMSVTYLVTLQLYTTFKNWQ